MKIQKRLSGAGYKARLCFLAAIFVILTVCAATVYAGEAEETAGSRYFIVSDEIVVKNYTNIYAFFSSLELTGEVTGDIYAFFSNIYISEDAAVGGRVRTLSSSVSYSGSKDLPPDVSPILGRLFSAGGTGEGLVYTNDVIPGYIIQLGLALFGAFMCFIVFGMFRGFVEQGGVLITAEPMKVIRNGIILYFTALALIIVFGLSIVLVPLAVLFLLVFLAVICVGQTSVSMLIGLTIAQRAGKRFTPAACLTIGLVALTAMSGIPFIGIGITYLFMPILTSGTVLTCYINGFIKKKFYYAPFKYDTPNGERLDRTAARAIILGSTKK